MTEPRVTNFRPRWARDLTDEDQLLLGLTPATGVVQPVPPRIVTRIIPADGSNGISFKSLSEASAPTQALASYAGNDVCEGFNPDFADLRSLSPEVQKLTRLTVEPFEPGSFVIPAVFETGAVQIERNEQQKIITAEDVAKRFTDIMSSFAGRDALPSVSIGAIQAIESFAALLRREAAAIEFNGHDTLGSPFQSIKVDAAYIQKVSAAKEARQSTLKKLEQLEGEVTALDISRFSLQLSLSNQKQRVLGSFMPLYLPTLLESLGKRVRLKGEVTWRNRNTATTVQIYSIHVLDEG